MSEFRDYKAICTRVIDGDTIECKIMMWPDMWTERPVRIAGIDCPETRGAKSAQERIAGDRAKKLVEDEFLGAPVILNNIDFDKYDRILSPVSYGDDFLASLDDLLLGSGLAIQYPSKGNKKWRDYYVTEDD